MEINDDIIDKLSDLARLKFEGEDRNKIKADLERMIDFIDKLNEIETDGVEPLVYMTEENLEPRKDMVKDELEQNAALKNAPSKDSDYFKVPKVLHK
ncbi:MAG: Asp-tRNA(Asn)/Glu-tRNA(Gln) amidotransferase subunit GatC [Flavobacteriales bacterium]|jgi:aspartyl-tRNA(Asn)/glutamyl-tRNA(Gln) amidotransferase subunit C|nr:Asp-tRNA(Asn)/Glu-tRNA(Gln) amidotransferase subunit GatC [Flavobacteriales bacterium]NCG29448.1 Asp-tRNA(Asn)/Glu-tRNA(Gln) amidotransferase subunit GatC [Bacteroidota bacterium]MBT3963991.1 Asp-tRNA(Asn)/Glu-tRNA(Gln) amidotransferase subunit GatC [Flavobacteriales bacterium]MBT4703902.1 Asp-tRNA(Asn)/Glu-tRNA(Gln) amidotransferase subunit GatC [Flavobacteriales bacterium]MBT4931043.1 Asp-tRNA(Asn)/Glu-tRNA(Gln) amidotransferase subunit GatC [Flavobacteriales bacterium]